ncbi:uncharacterized protein TRIADDRAFT_56913 [Trichoplax adhaerens]|uniref:BHLH domain-containing protein n=1 Tax=Trichoplax adhaerens TaxID=10228 RepID=B3RWX0_TRIAD|nr:hypothetical protein TRIADDRAFT_56913 [Trichoplax adhaerens]EDV25205.1 hypothetical protein TRIADDRAFT_56913 [Trichoplax adhaerens]|eukprot:XP_002113095.1 hypothetical protein TRIADDRAFT_56913 [Trichoplax adhaerens]
MADQFDTNLDFDIIDMELNQANAATITHVIENSFVDLDSIYFISPTTTFNSDQGDLTERAIRISSTRQPPSSIFSNRPAKKSATTPTMARRRKRKPPTGEQREAANNRERRRMNVMNSAFDTLRQHLPTFSYETKLSKIDTLKLSIYYINFMCKLLQDTANLDGHEQIDANNLANLQSYLS